MADELVRSVEVPVKEAGTTWVTYYEKNWWPVVICGIDTTPPRFFEGRRKPGHMPAVLLGKHKYIWVTNDSIEEYDPNWVYVDEQAPGEEIEKQRSIAFNQDAREFKNDVFWQNYILQQSEARKLQRQMNARAAETSTKQRKSADDDIDFIGAKHNYSLTSSSLEYSNEHLQLATTGSSAPPGQLPIPKATLKGKQHSSAGIIDISDHEESDNDDTIIIVGSNNKMDPFVDSRKRKHHKDVQRKGLRARPSSMGMSPPEVTEKECRILLGDIGQSIVARRARCAESEYLSSHEQYDENRKEHIIDLNKDKRAIQLNLSHVELTEIWQYLWSGDLGPAFLKGPDDYLPFGRLSDHEKERVARQLASAFVTASKIQHVRLQHLVEKKLNALYPLPAIGLLTVALVLTRMPPTQPPTDPEEKLGNWLVGSLACQFWSLAKHHTSALQRLLSGNDDLRESIYHKMQINADEGLEGCEEL